MFQQSFIIHDLAKCNLNKISLKMSNKTEKKISIEELIGLDDIVDIDEKQHITKKHKRNFIDRNTHYNVLYDYPNNSTYILNILTDFMNVKRIALDFILYENKNKIIYDLLSKIINAISDKMKEIYPSLKKINTIYYDKIMLTIKTNKSMFYLHQSKKKGGGYVKIFDNTYSKIIGEIEKNLPLDKKSNLSLMGKFILFFDINVEERLLNGIVQMISLDIHINSSEIELKYDKSNVDSLIDQNFMLSKRKISFIEI